MLKTVLSWTSRFGRSIVAMLAACTMFSCTKKAETTTSVIALKVPSLQSQKNNVGTLSTIPTDRKACWGVNIIASDMPTTPATTCSPKTGVTAGYVADGGMISVDVPRGEARMFELYMYLQDAGSTQGCPTFGKKFSASDLTHVYFMGSTTVAIRNPVEDITLVASFPGLNQTIASLNTYPATCTAVTPPAGVPGLHVSNGAGTAVGGGIRLSGTVGKTAGPALIGGGMRMTTN